MSTGDARPLRGGPLQHDRAEHRAARLAALLLLDDAGQLEGVPGTDLAQALGVDRTTVWRDKQDLGEVRRLRDKALAALRRRLEEHQR